MDLLAKEGAGKPQPHWARNKFKGTTMGLKLSTCTQLLIYSTLLEEKNIPELVKVKKNLERIQESMRKGPTKNAPTVEVIWRNLKQTKHIYRTQWEFIFKTIKNIQRVGNYWKNIPGCEERATCHTCQKTESMDHILTECEIPGQMETWDVVKEIWEKNIAIGKNQTLEQ